jgi:hypothetical protein
LVPGYQLEGEAELGGPRLVVLKEQKQKTSTPNIGGVLFDDWSYEITWMHTVFLICDCLLACLLACLLTR